jgi:hypothetical protein
MVGFSLCDTASRIHRLQICRCYNQVLTPDQRRLPDGFLVALNHPIKTSRHGAGVGVGESETVGGKDAIPAIHEHGVHPILRPFREPAGLVTGGRCSDACDQPALVPRAETYDYRKRRSFFAAPGSPARLSAFGQHALSFILIVQIAPQLQLRLWCIPGHDLAKILPNITLCLFSIDPNCSGAYSIRAQLLGQP